MRNKITITEPDVINNQSIKTSDTRTVSLPGTAEKKSNAEIIAAGGSEDFVNYVEWLGFLKDPDLVVLSSLHHYYYDEEEMKKVSIVVNLIELNQIKDVKDFIHSIFHLLPARSYFVGCFTDNQKNNKYSLKDKSVSNNPGKDSEEAENSISSRMPFLNTFYRFLDSRINRHLSGKEVNKMLGEHGFKVEDMTELNGLTYFCAQKNLAVVK